MERVGTGLREARCRARVQAEDRQALGRRAAAPHRQPLARDGDRHADRRDARHRAQARQRAERGARRLPDGARLPASRRSRPGARLRRHARRRLQLERGGAQDRHRQAPLRRRGHPFHARRYNRPAARRRRSLADRRRDDRAGPARTRPQGPAADRDPACSGRGDPRARPQDVYLETIRRYGRSRRDHLRRDGRLDRRAAHPPRCSARADPGRDGAAGLAGCRCVTGSRLDPQSVRGGHGDERHAADRLRPDCADADARRPGAPRQRRRARLHALQRQAAISRWRARSRRHRGPRAHHRPDHPFLSGFRHDRRERPQDRGLRRAFRRAERQRAPDAGHPDRASRRQRRGGRRRAHARRTQALRLRSRSIRRPCMGRSTASSARLCCSARAPRPSRHR